MLLLDENLSPRLVVRLESRFLGITHVFDAGLEGASDTNVWAYARENNLAIVSKDKDYLEFTRSHGHPPKVVLLTIGNCRVAEVEAFIVSRHNPIITFLKQAKIGLLQL
jgi:predicted nuclease of predicted toxin-antitoxin system